MLNFYSRTDELVKGKTSIIDVS